MKRNRTAIILGGGSGGIVAANTLRKLLPSSDRIVVVDRESDHLFAPSLLWLMIGNRNSTQISRPLDRLKRKGIEFLHGNIERIDKEGRGVILCRRPDCCCGSGLRH